MSVQVLQGDCREQLTMLPAGSVQTCVMSPPYFSLRSYGDIPGSIGLEPTVAAYITSLVAVCRLVRRALQADGTLWVNLGDVYNSYPGNRDTKSDYRRNGPKHLAPYPKGYGLLDKTTKHKDLIGLPWQLAFALRADGWYLRRDIVWHKVGNIPESVADRPTSAHEYLFLLSPRPRYYYDRQAVSTPARRRRPHEDEWANLRSVWEIPPGRPQNAQDAHSAVMHERVALTCILASTRPGDTVLDPFAGSGTTLAVAHAHGRSAIGIDTNPDYCTQIHERLDGVQVTLPWEEVS